MRRPRGPSPAEVTLPVPEDDLRDERHGRIAARAYEIYEARGGDHGQDADDWLQAEQQINQEFGRQDREALAD